MVGRGVELLIAIATLPVGATAQTLGFTDRGIGQVQVGAPQSKNPALAHSFYVDVDGNPKRHRSKCDLRAIQGSDNSYAWIINNRIVATGTADPSISLPSGLKVGMMADDMRRLEPALKRGPLLSNSDPETEQYYAKLPSGNQLRVTLVENEISEIAIGTKMNSPVSC